MEAVTSKTLEEGNTMMPMDCDQQSNEELQLVLTPESDAASIRDSPANTDWLLSDSNAKDYLHYDAPEGTQKTEETEKKRLKPRKRKKNPSAAKNEISSLLAELPFPQAEIREEYGFTAAPEKKSKRKRKRTLGGENEDDVGQKKKKKAHPNYFVSIPITNPKIVDGIKAVQDIVVQTDERLSKAMIPVPCLHVTILVMYLANEMEVNKAVNAIEECKEMVQKILQGPQLALQFQGIADFRDEVVFAQLVQNEHLTTLAHIAETVKTRLQANGILTGDSKAFKPHLTFMKLPRAPKLRQQGIKKFSPELYKNFEDHYFGDEIVTCLHLCSMLKKKQPNGYYHCETSVAVGEKKEPDEEELVSLSKRLVETAVIKAVQQYLEETQSKANRNTNGQRITFKDIDPNNGCKK
ncbi:A kinase (PRKA) anchor protein 7 isoform X2 [Cetorhinus maximus]